MGSMESIWPMSLENLLRTLPEGMKTFRNSEELFFFFLARLSLSRTHRWGWRQRSGRECGGRRRTCRCAASAPTSPSCGKWPNSWWNQRPQQLRSNLQENANEHQSARLNGTELKRIAQRRKVTWVHAEVEGEVKTVGASHVDPVFYTDWTVCAVGELLLWPGGAEKVISILTRWKQKLHRRTHQ